jgi:tetratricopeptide (TPR) repeat protein
MSALPPLSAPLCESFKLQEKEQPDVAERRSIAGEERPFKTWMVFLLLFGAVLAVYLPAIRGEKVWDDAFLIGSNEFFRSPLFVLEVFRHYLYPESFSLYYRPVQNLSYILDYWFWNENTSGYHFSNILFHTLSAFLLFLVLCSILPEQECKDGESAGRQKMYFVAFLVALVWAVHPMHHAAVAYIAGRADSLATMFSLGAWLLVLHARKWRNLRARAAALPAILLLGVLALCSKEIAITWMALFLVWTLIFDRGSGRRGKIGAIAGVVVTLLAYWAIRHLPEARHAAPGPAGDPLPERLILVLRALGDYSRILVLPAELHMERTILGDAPPGTWRGLFDCGGLAPIGLGVAAAVILLCLWNVRGRKVRILGAFWFLIGFLPISNLIPLNATIAEHWIYMASIGALLFLAGCFLALPPRFHRTVGIIVVLFIVGLSVRTALKVRDWTSNERLFSQTIEATGGSARMSMNLAVVHLRKGEIKIAENLLRDAMRRFPDAEPIRVKLASVFLSQGRAGEAEALLNRDPDGITETTSAEFVAMWNEPIIRARMQQAKGNSDQAIEILSRAERQFPHIWAVRAIHARILNEVSGPEAAIALVQEYTDAHWWCYPGCMLLGNLRAGIGDHRGAIEAFYKAASLDIHAAGPCLAIAKIQAARGNLEAMEAAIGEAIHRDPAAVEARATVSFPIER